METEKLSSEPIASHPGDYPTNSTSEMTAPESRPSYVKLAMRNMVRKRGKSLQHFFLTTIALLGMLIGLSYLTR